ncbi:RNA-binding protein [Bdellovibrio sp. KM01]|uniref:RNA recognition motif domain-containing protein n=1 Tax=Bdellovibrio sp. KM01 TaxID=2748865 RepID=UPI0015EA5D80|nr:RNA-binding protein [Bdellovibrio sp. KM01]QLY26042.1 RNA-binding protein [Bdellovibrio sp. KM01]
MGKKIYVGNLSFNVDSDQLTSTFSEFGTVESANIITDRDTGRSKGFAFVEMSSDSEATAAIDKLNGMDLGGRAMNISEAKPQAPRTGGGGGGGFRGNSRGGFGSGSRRSY